MYLTRQYLRGRITGFELGSGPPSGGHCGLDKARHLVRGDYLVRADDDLRFASGWLQKTVAALEASPDIGCLGLVQTGEQRRRGRPRKVREQPEPSDVVSTRCFVTRHSLFEGNACELMSEKPMETCSVPVPPEDARSHARLPAGAGDRGRELRGWLRRLPGTSRVRPAAP